MSVVAAQLIAKVSADGVEKTKSDLQSVGSSVNTVGGIFKSALGGPISIAASLAGKAFGFLKDQMIDGIKIAMEHQDVMAQTVAGLKSTHDASGMTAQAIDDLSTSLSKVTTYSADAIQGGDNILLTFTGIGKNVFPMATSAMLDMATKMHQDLPSAAQMLGKALNDPIQGMSALTRNGVVFSAQEKEQIKSMMAHNNIIGAQKVMLGELNTEFGGAAKAAGNTLSGALAILKNNFDELKKSIADHVLPIFQNVVEDINNKVIPGVENFFTALSKNAMVKSALKDIGDVMFQVGSVLQPLGGLADIFTGKIKDVTGKASPLLSGLSKDFHGMITSIEKGLSTINLRPFVEAVQNFVSHIDFKAIASGFGEVFQIISNASPAVNLFQALSRHAQELSAWFKGPVTDAFKQAEPGFKNLGQALAGLLPLFHDISQVVHDSFQKAFDALLPVFEKAGPLIIKVAGFIADGLGQAIKFLSPYVLQAAKAIGQFVDEVASRAAPIISQWIDGLSSTLDFFKAHWSQIWGTLGPILKGVWDEIMGTVKIAWALVSGVIKIGLDLMSGNWKGAWNDMKDMFAGVWDGIRTYLKGAISIMIGMFHPLLDALSHIPGPVGDMARNVEKSFDSMNKDTTQSTSAMKSTVLAHFIEMKEKGVVHIDQMRQKLIEEMKNTKDPVKEHALQMKEQVLTHMEQMQQQSITKMQTMKTGVLNHAKDMSDQMVGHSIIPDMINAMISWFAQLPARAMAPVTSFVGQLASTLGNLGNQASVWASNIISGFVGSLQAGIGQVGQAAQSIMSTVEDYIGVHSPTRKGPGTTLDQWGLNLVRQFTNDIRSKTPEARLAAEDMMLQIQQAISGATTQLNMAKLSGNLAGQLAAKNTLFDLNAQMSQYKNVIAGAGYSYNAKDRTSPIGFGGQTLDQMVALAGVNKFTKDIASTTTGAHKDAQNLFSNLLKSLDGFAMKIAMAQLSGNTDLVNKLQTQQTTEQTQLSIFQMLAAKRGLTLDETNMNAPITSFAQTHNTAVAPSAVQYQFLGSRNQTSTPMVVHVTVQNSMDGRMVTNALMPHIAESIRYNTGVHI